MVLETTADGKAKDVAWLKSKWWFRLFNVTLWIAAIFAALIAVLMTYIYTAEGCHAATLDRLETYNWGTKYPADSAKVDPTPLPKPYYLSDDGSLNYPNHEMAQYEDPKDPLGILGTKPTITKADDILRDLGYKEKQKDYGCVLKTILGGIVAVFIIFTLRKGLEMLFIYIAIGKIEEETLPALE